MKKVKIGIIGCGNISGAYLTAAQKFDILEVKACADLNCEAAKAKAAEYHTASMTVEQLLADKEIEIIINLTPPKVHTEINLDVLKAGKHVYSEKPFATTYEEGKKVIRTAKRNGLMVGSAPDTFLGGGLQTCRKLIDDNWIGRSVAGTAFMLGGGPEVWHPNPFFFYQTGGGPMFDMGPYYITALVHLLGPAKRICAITGKAFEERVAGASNVCGQKIPVEIPTHYAGTIEFCNGAIISVIISFDIIAGHGHQPIEIYGTRGSLQVPDPNTFGGPVRIKVGTDDWRDIGFTHGHTDNMRSIGAADMAYAIRTGRNFRCNGELALHVLEIMTGFEKSFEQNGFYELETSCKQPRPLSMEGTWE